MAARPGLKGVATSWLWCLPLSQSEYDCFVWCQICAEYWRRIKLEFVVEWPLLKQKWKLIIFGLIMQYVHGIFTQLAHRMHTPAPLLRDVGFAMTPELGDKHHWVSEILFFTGLISFIVWSFSPFVTQRKRFYTAVLWSRLLMVLVVCQALRIITFTVTSLPGPAHHCRLGESTATRPWPKHWWGHIVVDVKRQATRSCGDLIFSSHTTFFLTGILAYHMYGTRKLIKAAAWTLGFVLSCLIVASRKHYTVDVVVAWYTVPLVFHFMHRRWTTKRPLNDSEADDASLDEQLNLDRDDQELEEVVVTLTTPNNELKPLLPIQAPRVNGTNKIAMTLGASDRDTSSPADTGNQDSNNNHIPADRSNRHAMPSVGRTRSLASLQDMDTAPANISTFSLEHRHHASDEKGSAGARMSSKP